MAKRWTIAEVVEALAGGDAAERQDIARRFPLVATANAEELLGSMNYLTARVVEKRYREQLLGEESSDTEEDDIPSDDGDDEKAAPAEEATEEELFEE